MVRLAPFRFHRRSAAENAGSNEGFAPYKHGIGYGAWTHIDGWSEAVLSYIGAAENVPVESAEDTDE